MSILTDIQRATLRTFCDTVVPSLERERDPHGLWARSASDLGVPEVAEQALLGMPPANRDGLLGLLDGLAQAGFNEQSQASRNLTLNIVGLVWHAQMLIGQVPQPSALGQRVQRDQAAGRHEVRIIERHRGPTKGVRESHPRGALPG